MEKLKELVEQLVKLNNENDIIKKLQEIGDYLLTKSIKIGTTIIKLLWVEAYYKNDDVGFIDESAHSTDAQKNNFCKLYFHHKTGDRRSGVDLCVSNGDYYLSFLLKYTIVDDVFTTQAQLHNKIFEEYQNHQIELIDNPVASDEILAHTKRIGIANGKYIDTKLSSVRGINKKYKNKNNKLLSLSKKTDILKEHISDNYDVDNLSEKEKRELSISIIGEYWRNLF